MSFTISINNDHRELFLLCLRLKNNDLIYLLGSVFFNDTRLFRDKLIGCYDYYNIGSRLVFKK